VIHLQKNMSSVIMTMGKEGSLVWVTIGGKGGIPEAGDEDGASNPGASELPYSYAPISGALPAGLV